MTTITIENSAVLPKTSFKDIEELSRFIAQYQFELELEKSIEKAEKSAMSEFTQV